MHKIRKLLTSRPHHVVGVVRVVPVVVVCGGHGPLLGGPDVEVDRPTARATLLLGLLLLFRLGLGRIPLAALKVLLKQEQTLFKDLRH